MPMPRDVVYAIGEFGQGGYLQPRVDSGEVEKRFERQRDSREIEGLPTVFTGDLNYKLSDWQMDPESGLFAKRNLEGRTTEGHSFDVVYECRAVVPGNLRRLKIPTGYLNNSGIKEIPKYLNWKISIEIDVPTGKESPPKSA